MFFNVTTFVTSVIEIDQKYIFFLFPTVMDSFVVTVFLITFDDEKKKTQSVNRC